MNNSIIISIVTSIVVSLISNRVIAIIKNKRYIRDNNMKLKEEYRKELPDVYGYFIREFKYINFEKYKNIKNKKFINVKLYKDNRDIRKYKFEIIDISKFDDLEKNTPVHMICVENNKHLGNIFLESIYIGESRIEFFNKHPIESGEKILIFTEYKENINKITISNMMIRADYRFETDGVAIIENSMLIKDS